MPPSSSNNTKLRFITLENYLRKDTDPLVHFEQDDVIPEDKQIAANHLVEISNDSSNNQEYKPTNPTVIELGIRSFDGKPAVINTGMGQTEGTFFSDTLGPTSQEAISKFNRNSDTGMFDMEGENLGLNVVKGKQNKKNGKSLTLDELIFNENQVNGNIVSDTVFKRMEQTTRFNPEKPYLTSNGTETEGNSGTKDFIIQNVPGLHSPYPPGFLGRGNNEASQGFTITVDQLKNLGIQTMLKASGEYYIPKDEGSGESFKSLGSTLAPGLARIGQRVNYDDFKPSTIMDKVNPNYNKTELPGLENNGPKKKSFGSPYNPVLPFDGFISDGAAIVSAGAMAAAISGVALALSALFGSDKIQSFVRRTTNTDGGANNTYNYHVSHLGQNSLGVKIPKQNDQGPGNLIGGIVGDTENILGLVATKNDFKECVRIGLKTFFDPTNRDSRNIILTSPNYANTILRSITRDLVDVGLGIANLAGNDNVKGSLEVNSWTNEDSRNAAGTVEASFRMIGQLRENRMIRFVNIMAMLGDAVLAGDKMYTYMDEAANPLMLDSMSSQGVRNVVPSRINLKNFHKKGRLSSGVSKGAGGTSWASNTIASMYIRPKEIEIGSRLYLNNYNAVSQLTKQNYFHKPGTVNRLSQEQVTALEAELAGTYMPFYFHDLRTNEIISFHAFLTSVKDSFDADYSETEAYGRLGKIYKWKNTNRSVGLGFMLVSTSPQDFDEMWFKINKLVSFTMPQYTEGRKLQTEVNGANVSFAQPFSQLPAASPMVRMRLGDLFTTNYSKFDLARMFGIGNQSMFNVEGSSTDATGTQSDLAMVDTNYSAIESLFTQLNNSSDSPFAVRTAYTLQQDFFSYNGTVYRPMPTSPNINQNVDKPMSIIPAGEDITFESVTPSGEFKFDKGTFIFNGMPASLVKPSVQKINQLANQNNNTTNSNTTISKFLSEQENPIFKGFESTKGEGMAGFIKNVQFDWDESTIWGVDQDRKAPTMMPVSIDFLPVFDINPGIDSSGFMIGAPYRVGSIMKNLKDPNGNGTPQQGGQQ